MNGSTAPAGSPAIVELDADGLDRLVIGGRLTGAVVDASADTLRLRDAEGLRWELAVHLGDLMALDEVVEVRRGEGLVDLLGRDGAAIATVRDQLVPARSWDHAHWSGPRSSFPSAAGQAAAALDVFDGATVVIRISVARDDQVTSTQMAAKGATAAAIEERSSDDAGDSCIEVTVFDVRDLAMRTLEAAGLVDPAGFAGTADLLITAPRPDGRTRVTVLDWTGAEGHLTTTTDDGTEVDADPLTLVGEILGAVVPHCRLDHPEGGAAREVALS